MYSDIFSNRRNVSEGANVLYSNGEGIDKVARTADEPHVFYGTAKGEIKRIDPVDAMIDAHAVMLLGKGGTAGVDAEKELDVYLTMMGWN